MGASMTGSPALTHQSSVTTISVEKLYKIHSIRGKKRYGIKHVVEKGSDLASHNVLNIAMVN